MLLLQPLPHIPMITGILSTELSDMRVQIDLDDQELQDGYLHGMFPESGLSIRRISSLLLSRRYRISVSEHHTLLLLTEDQPG